MLYLSTLGLIFVTIPLAYLVILMIASFRRPRKVEHKELSRYNRFAIVIPAHDEADVIASTVRHIFTTNYPLEFFSVHVVADHCSDNTATLARQAGAHAHERDEGPRTGKGAALAWLFNQILQDNTYDAVVVFDADTIVEPSFLGAINCRLIEGDLAVQGQHIISNPDDGWHPALMWAMFLVDNRYQNLGRSNIGWSAKNMGDSISISADVIRQISWGQGLTEDYQLRQKLLLRGFKIVYEPTAKGFGKAAFSWEQARAQRSRWLRGTNDSSQQYRRRLLIEGLRNLDPALLDGALQAYLPSYSTLTMATIMALGIQVILNWLFDSAIPTALIGAWIAIAGLLFIYPLVALAAEKAPLKAHLVILTGPIFIVWRTWLALGARLRSSPMKWIRTEHGR